MKAHLDKEYSIPQPNYDLMWSNIETEAKRRQTQAQTTQTTNLPRFSFRQKLKAMPVSVAIASLLLFAVPVFAGVALNWDKIGGGNVATALSNGIGQQYDLHVSDEGVTMNLHGVVTDGEKMKMILSLDVNNKNEDLTSYEGFATENNIMTGEGNSKAKVSGYLSYDPDSKKLLGIYETPDSLKDGSKNFKFEAQNLIFYKNKEIPLKASFKAGDMIYTGDTKFPVIQIESISHIKEQTVIRYAIPGEPNNLGSAIPRLTLNDRDQHKEAIPTYLPTDKKQLLIEQVFDVNAKGWEQAQLHLTYTDEAKRISGTWELAFHADGKKASEAIYTKELQATPQFVEKTGITLQQLIISPLDIMVNIEEQGSLKKGIVHYNTAKLMVGDKTITGGWNLKEVEGRDKFQHLFQFESPQRYKNWADTPMKLILKDATVTKRDTSKNWVTLQQPTANKQKTSMLVDGFTINFTYYTEDGKLVVEASSDSKGFKSVNQTTLRINGKELIPDVSPKGMVSTGVNIDRYSNLPLTEKIELNPGVYKYFDPSRDAEIEL